VSKPSTDQRCEPRGDCRDCRRGDKPLRVDGQHVVHMLRAEGGRRGHVPRARSRVRSILFAVPAMVGVIVVETLWRWLSP